MPDVEHCIKAITIDASLGEEVAKLEAEGWTAIPGVLPVAVYHLVRTKPDTHIVDGVPVDPPAPEPAAAQGAVGVLRVDDTKIQVLRDGKLIPQ